MTWAILTHTSHIRRSSRAPSRRRRGCHREQLRPLVRRGRRAGEGRARQDGTGRDGTGQDGAGRAGQGRAKGRDTDGQRAGSSTEGGGREVGGQGGMGSAHQQLLYSTAQRSTARLRTPYRGRAGGSGHPAPEGGLGLSLSLWCSSPPAAAMVGSRQEEAEGG